MHKCHKAPFYPTLPPPHTMDAAFEFAVGGVVLEHIDHVSKIDEGIVHCNYLDDVLLHCRAQHQATNPSEPSIDYIGLGKNCMPPTH